MGFTQEDGTPSMDELAQDQGDIAGGENEVGGAADGTAGDGDGGYDAGLGADGAEPARGGRQQPPTQDHNLTRALNLEREHNRRMASELADARAEKAAMNQRWQEIQARKAMEEAQATQANADPEPDPIANPDEHDAWEKRQEAARYQALQSEVQRTQAAIVQQRQQAVVGELFSQLGNFELRFAATQAPDYQQAFDHLVGALANHYRNLGYGEDRIWGDSGALANEREQFLRRCLEIKTDGTVFPDGKPYRWIADPAVEIYKAAHRVGYARGNGQAAAAAAPAPAAPAGRGHRADNGRGQQLARAARGAAGQGGRGGEQRTAFTEADLANMSERDMAYLLATQKGELDRAMGR